MTRVALWEILNGIVALLAAVLAAAAVLACWCAGAWWGGW